MAEIKNLLSDKAYNDLRRVGSDALMQHSGNKNIDFKGQSNAPKACGAQGDYV